MLRCRCRSIAALLVLLLAFTLTASPAAAAPIAPGAGSWWSALAAGFDGLLGLFGLGGDESATAASTWTDPEPTPTEGDEGPGLEPDGLQALPGVDTDGVDTDGGTMIDPNG